MPQTDLVRLPVVDGNVLPGLDGEDGVPGDEVDAAHDEMRRLRHHVLHVGPAVLLRPGLLEEAPSLDQRLDRAGLEAADGGARRRGHLLGGIRKEDQVRIKEADEKT